MDEHVFTVLESQDWFPHMNPTQRCAVSVPDEMQRTKASRWLPVLSGARSSFWKSILKYRQVKTRTLSICIVNAFSLLKRRCYWSMPRAFLFFPDALILRPPMHALGLNCTAASTNFTPLPRIPLHVERKRVQGGQITPRPRS